MEWLVFALLCPAFWGLNNVFYKFLLTHIDYLSVFFWNDNYPKTSLSGLDDN